MNGIHDMGGMHGFGPVVHEQDEPVFSEQWERDSFAVLMAALAQGVANTDENRFSGEQMDPLEYLATTYYEHWLVMMETQLVRKGVITEEERRARVQEVLRDPGRFPATSGDTEPDELALALLAALATGGPTVRESEVPPRYAIGDRVITSRANPEGHTRLPRYARGRVGTVVAYHGSHVFPDTNASGAGEQPNPLFTVRFDGAEVWGDGREHETLHLDLWERYLSPADHETGGDVA